MSTRDRDSIIRDGFAVATRDGFILEQTRSLGWARWYKQDRDQAEPEDGPHRILRIAVTEELER